VNRDRLATWWTTTRVALKTIVVLLAALQLWSLTAGGRVELARAATAPASVAEPAARRPAPARPAAKPGGVRVLGLVSPPARLGPNSAHGRRLAAERGWTGREWACLYTLWLRESGWRADAQNPTSTAYGIAQFLDRTWPTVGARKTPDPEAQIRAGLAYIDQRYGTPCRAWGFWLRQRPHWY
jgi:hypothetical protein